ncbi:unnamed protein product [Prorocentrum cordatum]|uniref:Uncharacterized protein n=1 Tax=Prorocentrum cordatum TaxID=2364126 RepID=A0ABN9TC18_9DINO|nr:unnamed protein product [Polarella glacialis]
MLANMRIVSSLMVWILRNVILPTTAPTSPLRCKICLKGVQTRYGARAPSRGPCRPLPADCPGRAGAPGLEPAPGGGDASHRQSSGGLGAAAAPSRVLEDCFEDEVRHAGTEAAFARSPPRAALGSSGGARR